ncbi:hypothetical protein [Marinagarivorans algicola]|uniref:hypothetical protein n=1 Tax=Marinagarivorans algicola TaxID=1513270 RepID=UPI0006B3FEA5|nr:hypothetical protein [Marinagarivorans algicola]
MKILLAAALTVLTLPGIAHANTKPAKNPIIHSEVLVGSQNPTKIGELSVFSLHFSSPSDRSVESCIDAGAGLIAWTKEHKDIYERHQLALLKGESYTLKFDPNSPTNTCLVTSITIHHDEN